MQTYPPGTRIGQYEIASRPMMGGMGVVYFAIDHGNDGRPVAIKTFRPELLPDRAARDRFLREGTAWIELGSHPHIVRCYKVEYIDPTAFLVLELIAKEQNMPDASLRSWLIPGRPLPLEQALLFALQIARGMQHATEKIPGFVHRDLKPENILVGADMLPNTNINRLRVTDFGLVTILREEIGKISDEGGNEDIKRTQLTLTHGVIGTPLYMASEQWNGEPVGVFTDVYAFGCILYEMLSGQFAAEGKTIAALHELHCAGVFRKIQAKFSSGINDLLTKSLAINPNQRYGSWKELIDSLEYTYLKQFGNPAPRIIETFNANREENIQMGWSYNAIGTAYVDIGKLDLAVIDINKALSIGQNEGAQNLIFSAKFELGNAHSVLGDNTRAIELYEESLLFARNVGNRNSESSVLSSLGRSCNRLGQSQKAINYLEQSLEITRKSDNQNMCGHTLLDLGVVYQDLGDDQKSISLYEQSLKFTRQTGDRRIEGNALSGLGIAYKNLGNAQRAVEFLEHALLISREIIDQVAECNNLVNLGNTYAQFGQAQRSIGYYEQSFKVAREIGYQRGEGLALSNLGNVSIMAGNDRQAIEYYKQAIVLHRTTGNLHGIASVAFNLAIVLSVNGENHQAIPLANEAAQIWTQMGHARAAQARTLVAELNSVH
jgi:serine/threonine protein kinase